MLWVPRDSLLINLRKYKNQARVHFIPNLKVGVFVTLRAPDVIKADWIITKRTTLADIEDAFSHSSNRAGLKSVICGV